MPETNKIICGAMPGATKVFPDGYFNCSISSPPYWALRDYDVYGQLGLEPTFEEYIDKLCTIYDEVKRVLRDDGCIFVNLGDTYSGSGGAGGDYNKGGLREGQAKYRQHRVTKQELDADKQRAKDKNYPTQAFAGYAGWDRNTTKPSNVSTKSLCLIPQRFAIEMCRQRGKYVKSRDNQIWLAALVDGEGCIAIHRRAKGRKNPTFGATLSIYNTCKELLDKAQGISGGIGSRHTKINDSPRNAPVYEWRVMCNNAKDILRDIYPYLIAKRFQAKAAIYCPSSGKDAEESWLNIKTTNQFGAPTREYPEPRLGSTDPWILRNTIIWKKPNPMPSSAKDRFTVDFEYVFFFVKSNKSQYYIHPRKLRSSSTQKYDYIWIHRNTGLEVDYQPFSDRLCKGKKRLWNRRNLWEGRDYWFEPQYEPYNYDGRHDTILKPTDKYPGGRTPQKMEREPMERWPNPLGRNKRTVWTIPTQSFPEAHFATFPEKLVEPMIKAGCPEFVCTKCGKAREKIYDIEYKSPADYSQTERTKASCNKTVKIKRFGDGIQAYFKGYTDCGCNAEWRPGIVLDCFRGHGHGGQGGRQIAA